MGFLHFDL